MKRSQLNAALLIVSLALAGGVFLAQKHEEEKKKNPPLTPLSMDAVTQISLDHPGSPAVKLEKKDGVWRLTAPVQADADPYEVGGITSLATLEAKSTLDPAQVQPAELGLAPPSYSVTLNDQVIEFGGVEPLQFRRYLKAGGKIVLADDPPSNPLDADYSDLVSKSLLPGNSDIQKIALPGLTIAKSADGKGWTLTPDDPTASADRKQKLVDNWKNARSMWNAAETDAPAADPKAAKGKSAKPAKPETVVITLKDREITFNVAARDPQLELVRPDLKVRYTLSKALVDDMLKLPEDKKPDAPAQPASGPTAQ